MISEAHIIPYTVDLKNLRQNMQNGTVYPELSHMTRTSAENRMGGFQSFDMDLLNDFDTNITMICERYPKINKNEVIANIQQYIDRMFAKYKYIITDRFYVGLYNACMQQAGIFTTKFGTGCNECAIVNDTLTINPMFVYRMVQESHQSPHTKTPVYQGMINE